MRAPAGPGNESPASHSAAGRAAAIAPAARAHVVVGGPVSDGSFDAKPETMP
jgi:hypothetical protein